MTLAELLQYVQDETFLFKCNFPHYDFNLNRSLSTLSMLDWTSYGRGSSEKGS